MAVMMMRTAATEWPAVQYLELTTGPSSCIIPSDGVAAANSDGDTGGLSRALAGLMPNVRRVWLNLDADVGLVRRLCEQLVDLYAEQLCQLRYYRSMAMSLDGRFKKLTDVHIECIGEFDRLFPRMDPTRLERLTIIDAFPSNWWTAFSIQGDSRVIKFPALKSIDLTSSDWNEMAVRHPDEQPLELHFPRLQSARIGYPTDACLILGRGSFSSVMDTLSICGNTAMFGAIAEMTLPVVKRLELRIDHDVDNDASVYASIRHIFAAACRSEEKRLHISGRRQPLQPENIAFTGLTDLWIMTSTGVDEVFGCIRKLPLLTRLTISNCTLSYLPTDVTLSNPHEHKAIEPFKTRIQ
ncbi:hypothetical protein LPJ61_005560 [Coemansia biformis]|uniref:Uncharacterized protein n=1 Tax=Coemansia biformis TaxID=1286918 RepID=A0A9W8CWH7_9FUNG|nr:hypothetical protein LPJ61_005560 [Coemansia biformis]